MKTITIEVEDDTYALIEQLVDATRHVNEDECSHGPLTVDKLMAMLAEDVALAERRPGSWEGANMLQVLSSHGYHL